MKEGYFDRWRLTRKIVGIYEEVKQLMLIEKFQNSILEEIGIYRSKKKGRRVHNLAVMADEYAITHKRGR